MLVVLVAQLAAPAQAQQRPLGPFAQARTAAAATLPAGVQRIADVPYGPDPLQRMDIYLQADTPRRTTAAPVIFMVHGGAWRTGDKAMSRVVQEKVARWVPKGFVFISVNYRLHPAVNVLQEAHDVATALAAAQSRAATWGGDASKFILMGHSAGAHLVSLINASPTLAQREGAWPWLGTVSLDSAALNVPAVMAAPHYAFYDEVMGSNPVFWTAVSPYHALAGAVPPFQLVCSSERPDHPCLQAQGMAHRVQQLGGRAELLPQELSHGEINAQLGLESAYTRAVEAFMASLDPVVAQRLR
ncbi:MAG: alpha/beta hydrolase [Acidovorax sp.]|nr:MAG: alpha/beta hydrolase [Acidovorax sp.]